MTYNSNNEIKKFMLIPTEETSSYFSACYLALKDFLKFIRTYPDIIYKIIKLSKQKYLLYDFNTFIINNFYEDILNPDNISKDFIYVLEHLFKDIIGQCENPVDFEKVYKESNIYLLINSIICIKEVKIYFNSIYGNIINKYIISGRSSKVLFFDINELNNFIKNRENNYINLYTNSDNNQKKELEKKQKLLRTSMNNMYKMRFNSFENMSIESSTNIEDNSDLNQNSELNEEFAVKYLYELNKNEIKKQIQNCKDNKNLKDYLQTQLNNMNKNEDNLYSNSFMLEKIQKSKESEKILFYYERNFWIVIEIINEIIEQFLLTINNMPNVIKYILKIVVELLKNKFPHIKLIEIYSNLSCILIGIINNCFYNPNYNLILSDVLLGSKIKQNLNIINSIFSQLISFKFYSSKEKSDYTPFNLYFIENISSIYSIYDKVLEFNTPEITIYTRRKTKIFNFHSDSNTANNDKRLFYSFSICYRVEDITTLLNIIQQNKNIILEEKTSLYPNDKFKIIFDKLKDNKEILKALKEKEKQNSAINYYILFEIFYSNALNDLVNSKKYSPYFKLDKLENKTNSKKITRKNSLIQAQNALSELLINIPSLEETSIDEKNINNLKQIMSDLNSYIKNKCNIMEYFKDESIEENDETIPIEWYISSFLEMLEKMDEKYKKKEYEKFFVKFKKSIENEINEYNFDILGKLNESINNITNTKNEYNYLLNIFEEIDINDKVKEIIKDEIIEVEIKYKYNIVEKYLKLNTIQNNKEEENINININNTINTNIQNNKVCYNISDFIRNFPDLNEIQKEININIFNIMKELKINHCFNSYFNLINSTILIKYQNENKEKMLEKIKKYIFEKIYNKIFPKFPLEQDMIFSAKVITKNKIIPENSNLFNFDYDNIIPLVDDLFIKLDEQRCPNDKLNIIKQIFEIIFNIIKYEKGEEYSDKDLSNLCEYFLIKVKPEKINSNLDFIKIFQKKDEPHENKINISILERSIENLLNSQ